MQAVKQVPFGTSDLQSLQQVLMGNINECCSDGVLIPSRINYPETFFQGLPQFGSGVGSDAVNGIPMDQSAGSGSSAPTVPAVAPPTVNMDGVSMRTVNEGPDAQNDGPNAKDGYFVQRDTQLFTGAFKLPPMVFDQALQRGKPFSPFKFHKTRHTYFGEWKKHKFHGQGVLFFENGDYLVGTFRSGSPIGPCRLMLFSQGCYYEGEMRNWHAEGEGRFVTQNGTYSYQGRFHNSNADGFGIEETANSKFQGVFKNAGKVKGVLSTKTGYIYDGDFYEDKFHGFGKLISPNGEYIGEFNNGLKSGTGIFKWKDGSYYEGEYKNDLKHGKGKYVSGDRKTVHDGQWRIGKFLGTELGGGKILGKSTRTLSPHSHMSSASTISRSSTSPALRPAAPVLTNISMYKSSGMDSSVKSTSKYLPAASLLPSSKYVPANSNYLTPSILVTGASQYQQSNSKYLPNSSTYTPAVLTGDSFRAT